MKQPLSVLLPTLVLILAIVAYFAVIKMPLGSPEIAVVAVACLSFVLLVRWLFLRRQQGRKKKP